MGMVVIVVVVVEQMARVWGVFILGMWGEKRSLDKGGLACYAVEDTGYLGRLWRQSQREDSKNLSAWF
jgi:hypothetical protein